MLMNGEMLKDIVILPLTFISVVEACSNAYDVSRLD